MASGHEKLLLVDDDEAFRAVYRALLEASGYDVLEAVDRAQARQRFEQARPEVVLLDLMLPPDGSVKGGLALLQELLRAQPMSKIIVVSGAGDARFMVQAIRQGAHDFLTKPADPDVVLVVVERAMQRARLERRVGDLQVKLEQRSPELAMLGSSPAFMQALDLARRVAPTDLPVLLTGEHGTGKELMARTIHERSARRAQAFVPVNCGALTESLLESTLFGHVKGAFTGAIKDRPGLFAQADRGTLFLDELGEMPPSLQVKVLRAIEYGEILPVGSDVVQQVDVRLISATHRDLSAMMAQGLMREDLYWRICGAQVHLPPLRERPEDLPMLAGHFLHSAAALCRDGQPRQLTPEAEAALLRHDWPGNMRELRHMMQRASVLAGASRWLSTEELGLGALGALGAQGAQPQPQPAHGGVALGVGTLHERVQALERAAIEEALRDAQGNRSRAARALGLSRQGLLNKMERYRICSPDEEVSAHEP